MILAPEYKAVYPLFKTRKILKIKERDLLCCLSNADTFLKVDPGRVNIGHFINSWD